MHINRRIERFLREHQMPATKFGRLAARDPRLVLDIRLGRCLRPKMVAKVEAFMAAFEQQAVLLHMREAA